MRCRRHRGRFESSCFICDDVMIPTMVCPVPVPVVVVVVVLTLTL